MPSAQISPARGRELRETYPFFTYHRAGYELTAAGLELKFCFRLGADLEFNSRTIVKGVTEAQIQCVDARALQQLVFHVGLVEMLSYWKLTCSPVIAVEAGNLNEQQLAWWKELLLKGMGEYFYTNSIDFSDEQFLELRAIAGPGDVEPVAQAIEADSALLLTSGGKDTALTVSLLKTSGYKVRPLLVNPVQPALEMAQIVAAYPAIHVERCLDPLLFELNSRGFLNGHTPFSACLAFIGILVARLFGHNRIIASNERSSEEANLEYLGRSINHQYSKTFAFEKSLRDYVNQYLGSEQYFSMLRPAHEIQIVALLCREPELLGLFRSCNRNAKEGTWCGRCPKCVSTYILFAAFLDQPELNSVFGSNFLVIPENIPIISNLLGTASSHKPFECVASYDELLCALHLADHRSNPGARAAIDKCVVYPLSPRNSDAMAATLLADWTTEHFLPDELEQLLHNCIYSL